MTLGFKQQFPDGSQTHFVEKIWRGFDDKFPFKNLEDKYIFKDGVALWDFDLVHELKPKIHSMRDDKTNRWKEGNLIHMVINNRQPNRFQFAPTIPCSGTEDCRIEWMNGKPKIFPSYGWYIGKKFVRVFVNERFLRGDAIFQMAKNDGFDSVEDFFKWFNEDWKGKIIHWTPFRYVPESIDVVYPEILPGMTENDITKSIGDGIAKAIGGKVITYGNEWLDDQNSKK